MIFMRPESWRGGCAAMAATASIRHGAASPAQAPGGGCAHPHQETHRMQWQTPTATDFRFGFEITLYVAAR